MRLRNGVFGIDGRTGPAFRLVAASALALMLAGCSGGLGGGGNEGPMGTGNSDGQGGLGSTLETTTVAPGAATATGPMSATGRPAPAPPPLPAPETNAGGRSTSTVQTAVAGNGDPGANSTAGVNADDYTCPAVQVRGGAGSWQVTDKADGGVRYQANLGSFSRECHFSRPDMTMRVGIQGRVLLGAKGGPGRVTVPIRLAVVEEGPTPKPVWTKLYSVPVEIGQGILQVDFGLVADDVTFPLPAPATLERYVVYVGFDSQAGSAEALRQAPTRPRPAAQARPARPVPVRVNEPAETPEDAAPVAAPARVPAAPASPSPAVQSAPLQPTAPAAVAAPRPVSPAQATQPLIGTPQAPAAANPAPAANSGQWIGAPAPSAGGFSQ